MKLKDLDYELPAAQIAQRPLDRRDGARLLVLERETGNYQDRQFVEFPSHLRGDELLVFNNARVIPARLLGYLATDRKLAAGDKGRSDEAPKVEVFLTRNLLNDEWQALVRPGKKIRVGDRVLFGDGILEAEILERGERGARTLRFISHSGDSVAHHVERFGHVPLPPYIERGDEETDRERYQTVFAKNPGAIAAPTAGLHFTDGILRQIRDRGCEICEITLHVGLGTFQPIRGETVDGHKMHEESYEITDGVAKKISAARKQGRKIVAIGTTTVRALEASALRASEENSGRVLLHGRAEAGLFITPGFRFRLVDALLTNFHLPQSTLLALVCAFAGRDKVMAAYRHAVGAGYRFYSYGDCMLLG